MGARLVGLAVLVLMGVALVGCGSNSTGLPGGDPPAEVETVTVGTLSVGVASAAGFKTTVLPSAGEVAFTVLHGSEIVRLQEMRVGTMIAYMDYDTDWEIATLRLDGSGHKFLTSFPGTDGDPSWSPDGSKIAFYRDVGSNYEIYVMNADGTGATRLTNDPATDSAPDWSPDGSRIAFQRRDSSGGDYEIHAMNPDGTGETRLTDNADDDEEPSWSPDGGRIAYTYWDGNDREIYTMNPDGSDMVKVTANTYQDESPAWSPDGSLIGFAGYDGSDYEIYVVSPRGTGLVELTDNEVNDYEPAWSPDGRRIAYRHDVASGSAVFAIYTMDADGSEQRRLTVAPGNKVQPDWCPAPGIWRTLIGAPGTDGPADPPFGSARPFAVVGLTQGGMVSAATVTLNKPHWGSLEVEALSDVSFNLAGVKLTGPSIKNIKEDLGRGAPVRVWNVKETPATGAVLLFFSVWTGEITSVIASADKALSVAGDAAASGGRLVLRGEFSDVLTGPTTNLATGSAREVVLDSETGEVIEVH